VGREISWQDDGQDEPDADIVLGGPNKKLSLTEARSNFRRRAIDERFKANVRPPSADQM
jgi:hypothetical protein